MIRTPKGLQREYFMLKKAVTSCPCWYGGIGEGGLCKNVCLRITSCEDDIKRAKEILAEIDIEDRWAETFAWWL